MPTALTSTGLVPTKADGTQPAVQHTWTQGPMRHVLRTRSAWQSLGQSLGRGKKRKSKNKANKCYRTARKSAPRLLCLVWALILDFIFTEVQFCLVVEFHKCFVKWESWAGHCSFISILVENCSWKVVKWVAFITKAWQIPVNQCNVDVCIPVSLHF